MIVDSLFRYPIKSLPGEKKTSIRVNNFGRIHGDRIAAFRIGDNLTYNGEWLPKNNYLSLMHAPELIRIKCTYNSKLTSVYFEDGKLSININDNEEMKIYISKFLNDATLRKGISYFLSSKLSNSFHDSEEGYLSLHSKESIDKVSKIASSLDPKIFRSNIVIDNCDFFEEFNFVGKNLIIGKMKFEVVKKITRCNAINCNPETARYDNNILKLLPIINHVSNPSFGIKLKLISEGGSIKVGDKIYLES